MSAHSCENKITSGTYVLENCDEEFFTMFIWSTLTQVLTCRLEISLVLTGMIDRKLIDLLVLVSPIIRENKSVCYNCSICL